MESAGIKVGDRVTTDRGEATVIAPWRDTGLSRWNAPKVTGWIVELDPADDDDEGFRDVEATSEDVAHNEAVFLRRFVWVP